MQKSARSLKKRAAPLESTMDLKDLNSMSKGLIGLRAVSGIPWPGWDLASPRPSPLAQGGSSSLQIAKKTSLSEPYNSIVPGTRLR